MVRKCNQSVSFQLEDSIWEGGSQVEWGVGDQHFPSSVKEGNNCKVAAMAGRQIEKLLIIWPNFCVTHQNKISCLVLLLQWWTAGSGYNIVLDRSSLIPPKSEVCITYVGYHDIELRQMIMSRDELGGEIFVIFIMTLGLHHLPRARAGLESQNTNTVK